MPTSECSAAALLPCILFSNLEEEKANNGSFRIEFVSGGTTHMAAVVLCCCFCLGCIPYMASWFKDVEHKCGNCGALLAVVSILVPQFSE